jgi:hypothetical protein
VRSSKTEESRGQKRKRDARLGDEEATHQEEASNEMATNIIKRFATTAEPRESKAQNGLGTGNCDTQSGPEDEEKDDHTPPPEHIAQDEGVEQDGEPVSRRTDYKIPQSDGSKAQNSSLRHDAKESDSLRDMDDSDWLRQHTIRTLDLAEEHEPGGDSNIIESMLPSSHHQETPANRDKFDTEEATAPSYEPEDQIEAEMDDLSQNLDGQNSTDRLFIRNISYSATGSDIQHHFERFGHVEEVSDDMFSNLRI